MAVFGFLILGPSQHLWFNSVSKLLPHRDTLTTLKKIFLGQAILGPYITSVFFSYNAALQGIEMNILKLSLCVKTLLLLLLYKLFILF